MDAHTIEPFRVDLDPAAVEDLQLRLARTRWPEAETADGWTQGVPVGWLRDLCEYWQHGYPMDRLARRLNEHPQARLTVDGLPIHLVHARSPHPDALPLVLTHGWPGSVLEFLPLIPALTDPTSSGGRAEDAFTLVIPSLPGYGFSGKPSAAGWGVERIAEAWAELMARLGHRRYGAAGSDWGTSVSTRLAQADPEHVVGVHLVPPLAAPLADVAPTPEERRAAAEAMRRGTDGGGYSAIQGSRPQTIGYSLVDSPVGLCAWIAEKYWAWTDHDGDLYSVISRDDLLDTVSMYWFTGTGASAARLYWESIDSVRRWLSEPRPEPVHVPVGASVFGREVPRPSRRQAAARFPDIRLWSEHPRGGHFAALEAPHELVADLREFFRPLR